MSASTLVVLDYVPQFECIGALCEDQCCAGWKVNIDEHTYRTLTTQAGSQECSPELASLIREHIESPTPESTVINYSSIRMLPSGTCPFLGSDRLCTIQSNLGEESLPCACALYPREDSIVDGVRERSCTTSCPEVARLALLRPAGITLTKVDLQPKRTDYLYHRHLDTIGMSGLEEYKKFFWLLRVSCIKILQNRRLSMEDRLISLWFFIQGLERSIETGTVNEIPHLLQEFERNLFAGSYDSAIHQFSLQPDVHAAFLGAVTDPQFAINLVNVRFRECYQDFLHGLQITTGSSLDELWTRYFNLYCTSGVAFFSEHSYIFENFLVNVCFKDLFPCGSGSPREQYLNILLQFALIRMLLTGMSGKHAEITIEMTLRVIQSFGRSFEHAPIFRDKVGHLVRAKGLESLEHLVPVLRMT